MKIMPTTALLALYLMLPSPAWAEVKFSNKNGILFSGADDDTYLRIGGRLHLDGAIFDEDVTPLENDIVARRARVSMRARYDNDWRLAADYDVGELEGFRILALSYAGFENTRITLGNQVAPFSLDERTSSNNITFIERSLANALSPGLLVGLSASTRGDNWTLTAGVFGDEINDRQRRKGDGRSVAGRATWTPLRSRKGHLLHVGTSLEYRDLSDNEVRFRTRPESFVTTEKLVSTGTIRNANDLRNASLELAWRYRRLSAQGEYARTQVSREGDPSISVDAGYAAVSYFLTNHRRRYGRRSGAFGRITRGAKNAWEIAARYSFADLNDRDVDGGREDNVTLGLNWYINRNYRLMFNYIDVRVRPNADGVNESPSIFMLRFQAAY